MQKEQSAQNQVTQAVSTDPKKYLPSMNYPKPDIACTEESVLRSIFDAVEQIAYTLRHSPIIQLETENKFGDKQLHQDVHTDQIVQKHLRKCQKVVGFASQERPQYMPTGNQTIQGYIVTYDPLDGSSIIDNNFTVGSIFSIWPQSQSKLVGQKLSQQTNSVLAMYGPRTTLLFYNPGCDKVQELTLIDQNWVLSRQHLTISPKTKMFSPGNLRSVEDNPEYEKIVQQWISSQYTLRYTGGMVPDIVQIFIKGHGIFSNISSKKHKAKLRVLYEAAAVGFLIQKAGGQTIVKSKGNGQGNSLLDIVIETYDDRMQECLIFIDHSLLEALNKLRNLKSYLNECQDPFIQTLFN